MSESDRSMRAMTDRQVASGGRRNAGRASKRSMYVNVKVKAVMWVGNQDAHQLPYLVVNVMAALWTFETQNDS